MTDFASHDGDEDRLLEASPPDTSLDSQPESPGVEQISSQEHDKMTRLLYTSHFLSTWNSRLFEFGAFLFLAKIYPQTLLPASVYALSRAASAALFSPWLGSLIDRADRLKVVRLSIG
jgi:iron-regulated transporter 1